MDNLLDLYTDYLLTTPTQATCTGLLEVLHGQISHDRFTRLLSGGCLDSQSVWNQSGNLVKSTFPRVEFKSDSEKPQKNKVYLAKEDHGKALICLEHVLDTSKKFNLKNYLGDKLNVMREYY